MKPLRVWLGAVLCALFVMGGAWPALGAPKKLTPVKVTLANPIFNPGIAALWLARLMGWFEGGGVYPPPLPPPTAPPAPAPADRRPPPRRGDDLGVTPLLLEPAHEAGQP